MQVHTMMLGGLEPPYMKKLALYLASRLGECVTVGIMDDPGAYEVPEQDDTVWVGSEHFLKTIREKKEDSRCILLSEENGKDGAICRYQSCEKLYQKIMFCYRQWEGFAADAGVVQQKWIVLTADRDAASLMAFSAVCAQILGEQSEVLYLNFSECCGMERVFLLEEGTDLTDLVLALEKDAPMSLDTCVRRLEQMDYVLPPVNPMILHEIRTDTVARLIRAVEQSGTYRYIVVALGTSCCGCELFLQQAFRIFHLTGKGSFAECSRQEWDSFLRLCLDARQIPIEPIFIPDVRLENCGVHLLHEWTKGELGQIARRCLGNGEDR